MRHFRFLAGIVFVLVANVLFAANPTNVKQFINHKDWNFIENKGQISLPPLKKGESASINGIKYYGHQGGVYLYCSSGKISFVFTKVDNDGKVSEATGMPEGHESSFSKGAGGFDPSRHQTPYPFKINTSRTDLILVNSNPNAQILATDQQEYYENYYTTGDADHGITNVHTFKTITYKDVYPNIDIVLHAKESGMKYEFVVHPGGKVSDIQMQWNGLQNMKMTENGGIEYATALGKMDEGKPVSWQGKNEIGSNFSKVENRIGFRVGGYDAQKDLVIDPSLIWATYYGGNGVEIGNDIKNDKFGNIFITGNTFSTNAIATSGAYQTSFSGPTTYYGDAFLVKFNKNGAIQWGTYYGGAGYEEGMGIATDSSANIYMTGLTASPGLATSGAYMTSLPVGVSSVAFIAKFNTVGKITWATYYGGGYEISHSISIDRNNNLYITGTTGSSKGIATSGAYETAYPSKSVSSIAAFLAKFTSNGVLLWATYYGGNSYDWAYSVAADDSGNVYATGSTTSNSGFGTSGVYQTTYGGTTSGYDHGDAFLIKFDTSGKFKWSSYYGGSGIDVGLGIATDASGFVYIVGWTTSNSGLSTTGCFQSFLNGALDGFLAKFNSKGGLEWGTYFGGSSIDSINAIVIDNFNNIYITGTTTGSPGLATAGAYQTSFSGTADAFIAKFTSSGNRLLATYYGSVAKTSGRGVVVDNFGNVFITGYTTATSKIATSGAYQTSFGGNVDVILAKFTLISNDAGIVAITNPKGNVCVGEYGFSVQLKNFGWNPLKKANINYTINGIFQKPYTWSGNINPGQTDNIIIDTFNFSPGIDTIRAWTSYPNGVMDSINSNDSAISINRIYPVPFPNAGNDRAICDGGRTTIGTSDIGGSYIWTTLGNNFKSSKGIISISPDTTTTYILTEIDSLHGCFNYDTVTITVRPPAKANAGGNYHICYGDSITLGLNPVPGHTYSWLSNPLGFTNSLANPTVHNNASTIYYFSDVTDSNGCIALDTAVITVNLLPAAMTGKNKTICYGTILVIGDSSVSGDNYLWSSKPVGFSSSLSNPTISPKQNTYYYLKEMVLATGCAKIDSVQINVNPLPMAYTGLNQTICQGGKINLGTNPDTGSVYTWSSRPTGFASKIADPVVIPNGKTVYILTEKNSYDCTKTDSIIVSINPLPEGKTRTDTTVCAQTLISLGATAVIGNKYSWQSSNSAFTSTLSNPFIKPTKTQYYILTETDTATKCSKTDSLMIKVNPLPAANAGTNSTICLGTSVLIGDVAVSGSTYRWISLPPGFSSFSSDSFFNPTASSLYVLTETDSLKCSKTDTVIITVNPLPNSTWTIDYSGNEAYFHAKDSSYTDTSYYWQFGDGHSGIGHSIKHLYPKNQSYGISLKINDPNGCISETNTTINIIKSGFENEDSKFQSINLFPNPFSTTTTLQYMLVKPTKVTVALFDITGKQIAIIEDKNQSVGQYAFDISAEKYHLFPGVYLLKLITEDGFVNRQIVKF